MKRWEVQNNFKFQISNFKFQKIIDLLLENRGIKTQEEQESFITPKLEDVTPKSVGIDLKQLQKALKRIKKAIAAKEQIIVFGDYDVDGITGSAILWETLHAVGANALPYIPHRIDEGYGLSLKALQNEELKAKNPQLIITVDNGIVANEAVDFANAQGIDVIITDHHTMGEKLPDAHSIVHTTKLCGAGVAYLLSKELKHVIPSEVEESHTTKSQGKHSGVRSLRSLQSVGMTADDDSHLELAALGTVADLVPLTGANRTIVKYGLEKLSRTKRPGLLHLFKQAKLEKEILTTYDVGFIIAPRLNAAGRIESAMDSLRLLCTKSFDKAEVLSEKLELTNRERQLIMKAAAEHAKDKVIKSSSHQVKRLLFVADESYPQGVIGLVAGRLVEEFYRPSIVLSIGETYSKASVRSVNGFNVIEFLRGSFDGFVNIGGHPMAAGFTVETQKLQLLQDRLEQLSHDAVTEDLLTRSLKVDCELPLAAVSQELFAAIQQLAPFGMANTEPTFVSRDVIVQDMRLLGAEKNHLKLVLSQRHSGGVQNLSKEQRSTVRDSGLRRNDKKEGRNDRGGGGNDGEIEAIAFKMGAFAEQIKVGDAIDVVYVIDENTWNGNTKLQLKVRDLRLAVGS